MADIRYVNFKNVLYDLRNGNKLKIIPIPPTDKEQKENQIQLGQEKYTIAGEGKLKNENVDIDTLKNFDGFLSKYLEALKRLT